jgi:tetratricopeptide (TPR) repeat protein
MRPVLQLRACGVTSAGAADAGAIRPIDAALDHLNRSLTLQREVGSRINEAETMRCLAAVHRDNGRLVEAADLAAQALALARGTGERRYERMALNTCATIDLELSRPDAAIDQHREALCLARHDGHRYCEVDALVGLSTALLKLNRHEQARDRAMQAANIARRNGFRTLEGQALTQLAAAHLLGGDLPAAAEHSARAVALLRECDHGPGLARALLVAADLKAFGARSRPAAR